MFDQEGVSGNVCHDNKVDLNEEHGGEKDGGGREHTGRSLMQAVHLSAVWIWCCVCSTAAVNFDTHLMQPPAPRPPYR